MILGRTTGRKGGRKLGLKATGVIVAVAGLTALTACGSSSNGSGSTLSGLKVGGMYGSVPAESGTPHAGTIKLAVPTGLSPWLLPIVTAADNSIYTVYDFDYQLYRPLYFFGGGTSPTTEVPSESLASDPVWSNGDTTATITIKSSYKWSDGQPVTAKDVLFWFDEVKAGIAESPANWAPYVQGLGIPDEVASVTTPNSSTVVFNLKKSVNPTWFWQDMLGDIQPMPSHAWARASAGGPILDFTVPANATKIYNYLDAQSKAVSTYASNPLWQVVDGPYKLSNFDATTTDYTMTPNTAYSGPHSSARSTFEVLAYTSDAAEYNAVKAGAVDVGYIPTDDVPQAKSLSSTYNLFGYPDYGSQEAFYNFKDATGDFDNVIKQLYVRQALQHLVDQQGIIKAYLHGAGGFDYGTISEYPITAYATAAVSNNMYPYSTSDAASILKSHGWSIVPNGTDTCVSPGTAANECGAGIPAGTKLAWNEIYASEVALGLEVDTQFASAARSIGIEVTLKSDSFSDILNNDNDVATPKNDNTWAMEDFGGETNSTYPTTFGVYNTTGSGNLGGYSDPTADSLINASISSSNPTAVKNEVSYLAQQLPVQFQPNPDWSGEGGLIAVDKQLSGPPNSFAAYTQFWLEPELWYFVK